MDKYLRTTFLTIIIIVFSLMATTIYLETQEKYERPKMRIIILAMPVQVFPPKYTHFPYYPQKINFKWTPVLKAAWYDLEIDRLVNGQWYCQNGKVWKSESNIPVPSYTLNFNDFNNGNFNNNNPCRWRVRAANSSQTSEWSPWWYFDFNSGLSTILNPLNPPQQIFPVDNIHFTHYPRIVGLIWDPVPGADWYDVEIDCLNCRVKAQWDSENGPAWQILSRLICPSYSFDFAGDHQGRWRVRAGNSSQTSPWSPWWNFDFKTIPVN